MNDFYRYIFDDLDDDFQKINDPYVCLWCWVLLQAICDLYNGKDKNGFALKWIKDKNNDFFNVAAEGLGYKPQCLRQKILRMMENKDKMQVNKWGHISLVQVHEASLSDQIGA